MSRILVVSNYAWTVFNFRRNLIQALRRAGHEVCVQTEYDGYERRLGLEMNHVIPLDIDRKGVNPMHDLRTLFSIRRGIKIAQADTCLFFTIKPVVYGGIAATLSHIPFISNVTGLGAAFLGRTWLRTIAQALYKVGLARATRIFFQNADDMRLFLSAGLTKAARTTLLPGSGVDLSHFSPRMRSDRKHQFVFLLAARLLWDKGVGEFVEAARLVKSEFPNTEFRLIGFLDVRNPSAISRAQVQQWVADGIVSYLGATDDMTSAYAEADCIVLPSYYREGVPRTLLEAASMGLPVITTDAVGCRDAVEDGITGFLCQQRDAQDLADKMRQMLRLPADARLAMGYAGREKMLREFDERIVISNYLEAIRKIEAEHYAR
jgi:glycosyltransferase involved in cell wall biosynthesis